MGFSPQTYTLTRNESLHIAQNYISFLSSNESDGFSRSTLQNQLLDLSYYELLILQSDNDLWDQLVQDSDLMFRKRLMFKSLNVSITLLGKLLNKSKMTISDVVNKGTILKDPSLYRLAILLNYPVQSIFYENPNLSSYSMLDHIYVSYDVTFLPEMSFSLAAKKYDDAERLAGYIIKPSDLIYLLNNDNTIGRWVKTFPEFHYFELYLSQEPIVDAAFKRTIKKLFPKAEYLLTTFSPLRDKYWRCLWVIIPVNKKLPTYTSMLYELQHYRERTEFHYL